jgi:hypothetical protein
MIRYPDDCAIVARRLNPVSGDLGRNTGASAISPTFNRSKAGMVDLKQPSTTPTFSAVVGGISSVFPSKASSRSRWSCELLGLLLRERKGLRLSPETVRRGLSDGVRLASPANPLSAPAIRSALRNSGKFGG